MSPGRPTINLSRIIERWAAHFPDKVALHARDADITYREFWRRIEEAGAYLGVARGDRVAYLGYNEPSMLVLLFLYFAYISLAEAAESSGGGQSRLAAIFGLVGAVNIPIIHYSVLWWNSLHQPPSISLGKSAIDAAYLWPLMVSTLGFSLLFGGIVLARMRTILADQQAEARLRRKAAA